VPRYFLSLRYKKGPHGLALDEEGDELPDAGALREHVLETARDLISHSAIRSVRWHDCIFEVSDETGALLFTLPFSEVADPA
jgi:hypothetical protein